MWAIRSVVHLHVAMENIISFFINNKIQARRSSDKAGAFTYRADRKPALCLDFLVSGGGAAASCWQATSHVVFPMYLQMWTQT